MGSNASKGTVDVTVIANSPFDGDGDPRSPTPEISRTPLNEKGGSKQAITKNVDLRKTLEGSNPDEKLNNSILAAVIKNHLQTYDPRSPTQEFERTPIVISSKDKNEIIEEKLKIKSDIKNFGTPKTRNDHLNNVTNREEIQGKNLCNDFIEMTLENSIKDADCPLGSSTASNDSIEQNISIENKASPTCLLETSFDYFESNSYIKNLLSNKLKISQDDPRSPTIGIDRTPIIVPKSDELSEEDVEDMSDDKLIKVLQNTNIELRQMQSQNPQGLLIYEDEVQATSKVTPLKAKSASIGSCRTPLSCVKNKSESSHARSKSANTYAPRQKNAQSKIPVKASRIPRLKSRLSGENLSLKGLNVTNSVAGDCENTPPNSHRDCWAEDNSIVL